MLATVPSSGATTSFSIFIASRIINTSPFFTACPTLALTDKILPCIGEFTLTEPCAPEAFGAALGAAAGYGIGYLAGGTYANGLVAKSVDSGVKAFVSQANKVHHVLGKTGHNLAGYTTKSMGNLMRRTLINGSVEPYKSVFSAYWARKNSEVTFNIVNGALKISDMWIR